MVQSIISYLESYQSVHVAGVPWESLITNLNFACAFCMNY